MRKFLLSAMLALVTHAAHSDPLKVVMFQSQRLYRNTGMIILRDPISNALLGTYKFVTGGRKRGSAPSGRYVIGSAYKGMWYIKQPGLDDGDAIDPVVNDKRWGLLIHANGDLDWTWGCIGILGDAKVWADFSKKLARIINLMGTVGFDLEPAPDTGRL